MANKTVVAFDAYGTLLSTSSIAKQLAEHFGQSKADTIAQAWRKYQLEYTWRLNSMKQYQPFDAITKSSLKNALAESGLSLGQKETEDLLAAYDVLEAFPDVPGCLEALNKKQNITSVVFSNGTQRMIEASITKSPQLKDYTGCLSQVVTVEEIKCFKPDPEVYHHLARKVGKDPKNAEEMKNLWLVSGNPFDIVGARSMGMSAAWVDRAGNGWQDALADESRGPTVIVKDLKEVVDAVSK